MQVPTLGRIVMYRSKLGGYTLPAIVTATVDTLAPEGVEAGDVPALSSESHVHLRVFTPGAQGDYAEHDVPFEAVHSEVRGLPESEQAAGSWAWPARVSPDGTTIFGVA